MFSNNNKLQNNRGFYWAIFLIIAGLLAPTYSSALPSSRVERQIARQIQKQAPSLEPKILKLALRTYHELQKQGKLKKPLLTIVDYSLSSKEKRLWVINVKEKNVKFNTHVSHGKNSGLLHATQFSNRIGSKQTSIGTYITGNTYHGKKGYSMNLFGLEKGINDNAHKRGIIFHGANYAKLNFINQAGRLGRSWGCFALSPQLHTPLINTIKDGSMVFAYYPDQDWLKRSPFVIPA